MFMNKILLLSLVADPIIEKEDNHCLLGFSLSPSFPAQYISDSTKESYENILKQIEKGSYPKPKHIVPYLDGIKCTANCRKCKYNQPLEKSDTWFDEEDNLPESYNPMIDNLTREEKVGLADIENNPDGHS